MMYVCTYYYQCRLGSCSKNCVDNWPCKVKAVKRGNIPRRLAMVREVTGLVCIMFVGCMWNYVALND